AEARRHLETALSFDNDPPTAGRLTEAASRAALMSGAANDAAALAQQARDLFTAAGMKLDAARTLTSWAEAQIHAGMGHIVVEPLTAAYEELAHRPDATEVAAGLALGVARAHYLAAGESEKSIPWFDRAVNLAEAMEDLPFLATALASYGGALILVGRSHMGLGLMRVALDLARRLDDPAIQLRPLNNLASFLATRDLAAAAEYGEEGLTVAQRVGDQEWYGYVQSTLLAVYWNAADWDRALERLGHPEDFHGAGATKGLAMLYLNSIRVARGLPPEHEALVETITGQHGDLAYEMVRAAFRASAARTSGDLAAAAAASQDALQNAVAVSGVDDDFAIFWVLAIDDHLAAGDTAAARTALGIVGDAPRGHISPMLRCLFSWPLPGVFENSAHPSTWPAPCSITPSGSTRRRRSQPRCHWQLRRRSCWYGWRRRRGSSGPSGSPAIRPCRPTYQP